MASEETKQYYAEMFEHRGFKNIEVQKGGEIDILMNGHRDGHTIRCGINCSHTSDIITRDMLHGFYTTMLSLRYAGEKVGYIISRKGFTQKAMQYGNEINRAQTSLKFIFVTDEVVEKYEDEIAEAKRQEEEAEQKATVQQTVDLYEAKLAELRKQNEAEHKQLAETQKQLDAERQVLADKLAAIEKDEAARMENFNRKINKLYHESLGKHLIAVLRDDLGFARLLSALRPGRFKFVFYIELLLTIMIFALIVYLMVTNNISQIW